MSEQLLTTSIDADTHIALLTLNRPEKKNALSIALRDAVSDALDSVATDPAVKVVVLTGAGSAFSAGFDLGEFSDPAPEHQRQLWASSDRFHHGCLCFPLPMIAAVNGLAVAGGFDLAVMADLRVAADSAYFSHPEQQWSDVVYRPLRELIGGGMARELVLTGRRIDAPEAHRIGLVNVVVPAAEVVTEALRIAAQIAAAPRANLMRSKAKMIAAAGIDPAAPTLSL